MSEQFTLPNGDITYKEKQYLSAWKKASKYCLKNLGLSVHYFYGSSVELAKSIDRSNGKPAIIRKFVLEKILFIQMFNALQEKDAALKDYRENFDFEEVED